MCEVIPSKLQEMFDTQSWSFKLFYKSMHSYHENFFTLFIYYSLFLFKTDMTDINVIAINMPMSLYILWRSNRFSHPPI